MVFEELLAVTSIFVGLAALRFGLPALIMFLIKQGCCRVLRVNPQ